MSSITKTLAPVYAKNVRRSLGYTRRVHLVELESWTDHGIPMRNTARRTLCGVLTGQKVHEPGAPPTCPKCRAEKRRREAAQ